MMKKFSAVFALVLVAGLMSPVHAQDAAGAAVSALVTKWAVVTAGFALAIAAAFGAMAQGRAVSAAAEGIARNPGAADQIRGVLLLGLVLIESLVIYVLLVSLIIFFVRAGPLGLV
ncbi:MAG: ATP synthase F0 subunit C [Acidobacteria bacterium]|nr:ATP synthase F0 subunit C [Acidobacteriota bacterium]